MHEPAGRKNTEDENGECTIDRDYY